MIWIIYGIFVIQFNKLINTIAKGKVGCNEYYY